MPWVADLHIHSHFSMATSKECNPQNLYRWARLKGISLVGSGDFTHPGWRAELRDKLITSEPGFYRLKEPGELDLPDGPEVRFVISGELSTIYKKNGRVRKVHHLVILPSLEAADWISNQLEELGMNIRADGRPILGMDSHRLLELILNACPEVIFIPAHIWTPHFSVFGSNSGFDDIIECYEDLTRYIFALETGLSSDPPMNWRWSALDRFTLVSNSDAHNPTNLAREANLFNAEFSYQGLKNALQDKKSAQFVGTLEFFPEEGKYHYDGHRNCDVCLKPEETIERAGICPICGRKVTVGVLHRVAELADRPEGFNPSGIIPYESLVPLREIIGSAINCGPTSQRVQRHYFELIKKLGPELTILREADLTQIAKVGGVLVAEGIRRLRAGEVSIQPGYDGAYGIISVLREDDRQALKGQAALFESDTVVDVKKGPLLGSIMAELSGQVKLLDIGGNVASHSFGLSPEQNKIVHTTEPITIVIAGPGAGKTRTLVERIAYLINEQNINPAEITGVTFTNKAAAELRTRLVDLFKGDKRINRVNLGTFHSLAWKILNKNPQPLTFKLLDEFEARDIIEEVLRQNRIPMTAREAALIISLVKNKYLWETELAIPPKVVEIYQAYQRSLQLYQRYDFDDVLIKALDLWEEDPEWLGSIKQGFNYILVDEFQDINLLQYKLVKLWAENSKNLMAIGDPNQSIYGFRGASAEFFDELSRDFPKAVTLHLSRNYRALAPLIKAANNLISAQYRQTISESDNTNNQALFQLEALNEKIAARIVADQIIQLLGGSTMLSAHGQGGSRRNIKINTGSYSFNDIAILYRTGKQALALEHALTSAGLPYRVVGPTGTLESSTVKEFLSFFRYLNAPEDLFLLRANLRQPRWGFKNSEVTELVDLFTNYSIAVPDKLDSLLVADIAEEKIVKLQQFYGVVQYYRTQMNRKTSEIIDDWLLRMDPVEPEELEHLKKICENYHSLEELLRALPLSIEADIFRKGNKTTGTEVITLSTIHAAKGLEFPVVFIAGIEEGLIPYGAEPAPDTIAEEQRLFYVGVTRAQQQLYLVNSQFRSRYGEQVQVNVSRFMKLLPNELLQKIIAEHYNKQAKQLELF